MGKILVIGAAGLIGAEVVKALGPEHCLRASRSSDEKVDISDPKSLEALFGRVGRTRRDRLHRRRGPVQAVGSTDRRGLDVLARQQAPGSGQRRPLRLEERPRRRRDHVDHGSCGAISRSRQRDHHHGQFRRRGVCARGGGGAPIPIRVNAVSPGWVSETLKAFGRDPAGGVPAAEVARITVRQFREGASGSVAAAAKG